MIPALQPAILPAILRDNNGVAGLGQQPIQPDYLLFTGWIDGVYYENAPVVDDAGDRIVVG